MSPTHTLQRPDGSAQVCLGVGLGVSDVPSSWGQGRWHQGRKRKDFFSHLLGLVLLGASRLLAGAVGTESERVRALSPPQPPGGGQDKHHRRVFLAPEAALPIRVELNQQHPLPRRRVTAMRLIWGHPPHPQALSLSLSQQTPSHQPPQA